MSRRRSKSPRFTRFSNTQPQAANDETSQESPQPKRQAGDSGPACVAEAASARRRPATRWEPRRGAMGAAFRAPPGCRQDAATPAMRCHRPVAATPQATRRRRNPEGAQTLRPQTALRAAPDASGIESRLASGLRPQAPRAQPPALPGGAPTLVRKPQAQMARYFRGGALRCRAGRARDRPEFESPRCRGGARERPPPRAAPVGGPAVARAPLPLGCRGVPVGQARSPLRRGAGRPRRRPDARFAG